MISSNKFYIDISINNSSIMLRMKYDTILNYGYCIKMLHASSVSTVLMRMVSLQIRVLDGPLEKLCEVDFKMV